MLEIEKINVSYGDLQALWDVSFEVEEKEIVALIGPNGAGKTTTLKTISGLLRPFSGEIKFQGIRHWIKCRSIKEWNWESAWFQRAGGSSRE